MARMQAAAGCSGAVLQLLRTGRFAAGQRGAHLKVLRRRVLIKCQGPDPWAPGRLLISDAQSRGAEVHGFIAMVSLVLFLVGLSLFALLG